MSPEVIRLEQELSLLRREFHALKNSIDPFRPIQIIAASEVPGIYKRYEVLGKRQGVALQVDEEIQPFWIEVTTNPSGQPAWRVVRLGSSITDDEDDSALDINGLDTLRTTTGKVAVKVTISNLSVTSTPEITVGQYSQEIEMDSADPPSQIAAWLLIGEVFKDSDGNFSAAPAINSAQRLTYDFINGSFVRVFASAPVHPSKLEDPSNYTA